MSLIRRAAKSSHRRMRSFRGTVSDVGLFGEVTITASTASRQACAYSRSTSTPNCGLETGAAALGRWG